MMMMLAYIWRKADNNPWMSEPTFGPNRLGGRDWLSWWPELTLSSRVHILQLGA